MSHLESKKCNYLDFDRKYSKELEEGIVTKDIVYDIINILKDLSLDRSIYYNSDYHIEQLILLLIRYRFDRNCQSISWIEPIRLNNWYLLHWFKVYPELANNFDKDTIQRYVEMSFYYIYNHDEYIDIAGDELIEELTNEFNVNNLANIDFIENYLKKYAKNSKVKRQLQII